ncbi:hypothetical protein [Peterkaempfera sp. SMS 1(5)a]|uniref:hypothetical protein n=1 Tax=Peterkaempfera podocarpi TaxID=3232308 RepID=UPI00366D5FEE
MTAHHNPTDDLLVRDLLGRAADELEPPAGLVASAVALGHRRRRTRRVITGTSLAGAALVLGTLAAYAPGGPTVRVGPASSGATGVIPSPTRTFPIVHPPSPGTETDSPADRSPQEHARVALYRQQVAAALQDLLPAAIGNIRLVDGYTADYEGVSGSRVFPVTFSVRPAGGPTAAHSCGPVKGGGTCRVDQLPGGVPVTLQVGPTNSMDTDGARATFHMGGSDVTVSVDPDDASRTSAPITADQLLAFVGNPRVLSLVRAADAQPVQAPQISVNEGGR